MRVSAQRPPPTASSPRPRDTSSHVTITFGQRLPTAPHIQDRRDRRFRNALGPCGYVVAVVLRAFEGGARPARDGNERAGRYCAGPFDIHVGHFKLYDGGGKRCRSYAAGMTVALTEAERTYLKGQPLARLAT